MLEFEILSDNKLYNMLLVLNKGTRTNCKTLIDTGASIPVWVSGLNNFLFQFPDAYEIQCEYLVSGFGTGKEVASIYIIPEFVLSDGKEKIIYHKLPVAIIDRDFSFNMIISNTMLSKFNYKYVAYTNKNSIKHISPLFRIYSEKVDYYIGLKMSSLANINKKYLAYFKYTTLLSNIYVFTNAEVSKKL